MGRPAAAAPGCLGASARVPAVKAERPLCVQLRDLRRDARQRARRADSGLTGSFRAFVGDFRPKLLQRPRCHLVLMSFGVVRSPGILIRLPRLQFRLVHRGRTPPRPAAPAAKIRSPARKPGFKSVKNGHHSEPHIQVDWLQRARSGCGSFFLMLPTIGAGRPA